MPRKLVNPTVKVWHGTRVIRGRDRTGYRAIVVDPDAFERKWDKKMPVWQCPHAHLSESGAQLCGAVYVKQRMAEEQAKEQAK